MKKQVINLSENMRLEVISGGNLPEITVIHDIGTTRYIGVLARHEDLYMIKKALKNVESPSKIDKT